MVSLCGCLELVGTNSSNSAKYMRYFQGKPSLLEFAICALLEVGGTYVSGERCSALRSIDLLSLFVEAEVSR